MGLGLSHGDFHTSYSGFTEWRAWIAGKLDMPPLKFMEFYYKEDRISAIEYIDFRLDYDGEPVKWDSLPKDDIHILMLHSDCEGDISPEDCKKLSDRLTNLLQLEDKFSPGIWIENYYIELTKKFIDSCNKAFEKNEPLEFH